MSFDRNLSSSSNIIMNREPREWRGTKSQLTDYKTPGCKGRANMYTPSGLCFDCIHVRGECAKCGCEVRTIDYGLCVRCLDGGL